MTDKLWEHYIKGGTPGEAIALKLANRKQAYAVYSRWKFCEMWHAVADWMGSELSMTQQSQIRKLLVEKLKGTQTKPLLFPKERGNRPNDPPHKASLLPNQRSSQKQGEDEEVED
jgi:hypothetical protein